MINKEEKSMFEGEKMSFVIIGTTLLLSFIIMYFCKAVTSNSDNGVDISNLKVAQNKAEEYYFERQYEKAIAEYIKQGEGQEWPINKVKIAEIYSVMGETEKSNNLLEESVINRYTLIDSNKINYTILKNNRGNLECQKGKKCPNDNRLKYIVNAVRLPRSRVCRSRRWLAAAECGMTASPDGRRLRDSDAEAAAPCRTQL